VTDARARRRDALLAGLLVVVSFLPYVTKLGFHADDLSWIGRLVTSPSQSFSALYGTIRVDDPTRPALYVYLASLYTLFGPQAAGFHVVLMLLMAAATGVLTLTLARAGVPRDVALAVPLLWALLPHHSTVRFWLNVSGAVICAFLFFVSFYAEVRAEQGSMAWKLVALPAAFAGALFYEPMVPFLLVPPLLILLGAIPERRERAIAWRITSAAASLATTAAIVMLKLRTLNPDRRVVGFRSTLRENLRLALASDIARGASGFNLRRALSIHFGDYFLRLPRTAWVLGRDATAAGFVAAAAIGLVAFLALRRLAPGSRSLRRWALTVVAGLAVYLLGFGVFFNTRAIQLTPTGSANRTVNAAAIGVAIVLVGVVGAIASILPAERHRREAFALGIGLLSFLYVVVLAGIASHWVGAAREQQRVLARVREVLPTWPGGTVLLDGVCPYDGPAAIFDNMWDTTGALQALYRSSRIAADVLTRAHVPGPTALFNALPGTTSYPYRPDLLVLHLADGTTEPLPDADRARRVLAAAFQRMNACPDGVLGFGAELLDASTVAHGPGRLVRLLPESVEQGAAFNRQPDGSSVIVTLSEGSAAGTVIVFAGQPLPTAHGADGRTLTAAVPAELVSSAGPRRVHLQRSTEASNELAFVVLPAANAAELVLTSLHPARTRAGEPFNRQPDGGAALAVACSGATRATRIVIDGEELPTMFGSGALLTAIVPRRYWQSPGAHRVHLVEGGRTSNGAELTVTR